MHIILEKAEKMMLVIDKNSVYEIDEECLKQRRVPKECGTAEKVEEIQGNEKNLNG